MLPWKKKKYLNLIVIFAKSSEVHFSSIQIQIAVSVQLKAITTGAKNG